MSTAGDTLESLPDDVEGLRALGVVAMEVVPPGLG